ncbi:MAG: RNA methyltransferase [Acidimicrobiia bacterium]|nr:RNA methyltransferase [Acidimicrobiia bacterium]NNL28597.1 RNA methyltransferase [Acidimicrobiia bacterium]
MGQGTGAGVHELTVSEEIGVGPHPLPWPSGEQFDERLLADGDRRNVLDQYRYWTVEAIVADLDRRRHAFHVAVENWQHDFNIGTVVRNANAFLANRVHIVGKKRWNRRGAMVTDRYVHIDHYLNVAGFAEWAATEAIPLIGIDIVPNAVSIERFEFPERCCLVFGQEGPGLSSEMRAVCSAIVKIPQYGSTRSVNVGVASGIAMHSWIVQHTSESVDGT